MNKRQQGPGIICYVRENVVVAKLHRINVCCRIVAERWRTRFKPPGARSFKWPVMQVLSSFLISLSQLLQYLTLNFLKSIFAFIVSLMLNETFVWPQLTHFLLNLRNKLSSYYRAITSRLIRSISASEKLNGKGTSLARQVDLSKCLLDRLETIESAPRRIRTLRWARNINLYAGVFRNSTARYKSGFLECMSFR